MTDAPHHDLDRRVVVAVFVAYLVTGVVLSRGYGGSWDEPYTRDLGARTFQYVAARLSGNPVPAATVFEGMVAETGPFFETALFALERLLGLEDSRAILLVRHAATFVMCWFGALAFYELMRLRFESRRWGLVGAAFLVLTPRLFAHGFYNSKDAVLAAFFAATMLTLLRFRRAPTVPNAVLHALACAVTIDVRLVGLLLPALTVLLLAVDAVAEGRGRRLVLPVGVYLMLLVPLVVVLWPQLWGSPVQSFLERIAHLRNAAQYDNDMSLYRGEFVPVTRLPWHYLPWWMLITIPLPLTVAFLVGLGSFALRARQDGLRDPAVRDDLLFVLVFALPVGAALALRPILYDDWRHFYFVYPAFVALAVGGFVALGSRPSLATPVLATALLVVAHLASMVVRLHPYENVYFNVLAGGNVEERYELDYWGLSFRAGLEWVLAHDLGRTIPVHVSDYPGVVNLALLTPNERQRIQLVELDQAAYFLSNHRQPEHYRCFRSGTPPCSNEVYAVRAGGARLLAVYQLHAGAP